MKQIRQKQKNQAYYFLKLQAMAIGAIFIILFGFFGLHSSGAALIGGVISLLANIICAQRMFMGHTLEAKSLLDQFYLAEVFKIVVTVLMFVIIYRFISLNYLFLIVGYSCAQLSFWLAPLLTHKNLFKLTNLDQDAGQML